MNGPLNAIAVSVKHAKSIAVEKPAARSPIREEANARTAACAPWVIPKQKESTAKLFHKLRTEGIAAESQSASHGTSKRAPTRMTMRCEADETDDRVRGHETDTGQAQRDREDYSCVQVRARRPPPLCLCNASTVDCALTVDCTCRTIAKQDMRAVVARTRAMRGRVTSKPAHLTQTSLSTPHTAACRRDAHASAAQTGDALPSATQDARSSAHDTGEAPHGRDTDVRCAAERVA